MKLVKLSLLFFLGLVLFTGCSNDDDNSSQTKVPINGIWNLKNVNGGFSPINIDYNQGEVLWTFNQTNSMLIVENNILTTGPEDIYAGIDSGSYSYTIEIDGETQTLLIDGAERGFLIFSDGNLEINDSAADGFVSEFER